MPRNDGTKSEQTFKKYVEGKFGKFGFLERIPDHKEVSRGGKVKNMSMRNTPADWLLTTANGMKYVETKSSLNKTSFPFSNFTAGQNRAMKRQTIAGGEYLIVLHNLNTNRWYEVPATKVIELKEEGRSSFKWEEIEEYRNKEIEEYN